MNFEFGDNCLFNKSPAVYLGSKIHRDNTTLHLLHIKDFTSAWNFTGDTKKNLGKLCQPR